ncbi:helix-turn-helix domain-containing protein [Kitasatospora sp. NPDC096204]|uniref:helix-turn-helix domain-containing protein n=1 Tax=Kitasatospora sp. NPDC096204 TaxID=3364094 RepID=UPI0038215EF2
MGRPRSFDEAEVVRRAADLFAARAYDAISVDDLVSGLGVHRHSLYRTFGSKRGLYLAALGWSSEHRIAALAARIAETGVGAEAGAETGDPYELLSGPLRDEDLGPGLDLLLLALVERAPQDREVARIVAESFALLDGALGRALGAGGGQGRAATGVAAALLGLRALDQAVRPAVDAPAAGAALLRGLDRR